jgi:hypothetical protein
MPTEEGKKQVSDLITTICAKIKEMVTLEITTAVGTVEYKEDAGAPATTAANCKAMESKINLIDGDITSLIDQAFVTGDYKELRAFHQAQEARGQQIIKDNIAALKELLSFAAELLHHPA